MKNTTSPNVVFYFLAPLSYLTEFILLNSLPQSHSLNGVLGGLWTIGQIGIIITLIRLYRINVMDGKWKGLGLSIAATGAICYIINYLFGYWLHWNTRIFLPLGALLTGIGMTVVGVQILITKRWRGTMKAAPLLVGLYPFVIMFPLVILTGHPDLDAILGWGIPWLILGYAMTEQNRKQSDARAN